MVIKKDGRREIFDPQKLLSGLLTACQKRAVSRRSLEEIVAEIAAMANEAQDNELPTEVIGQRVAERLRALDQVAYVRFASVYREFQDVEEFLSEVRGLIGRGHRRPGREKR